MLNQTTAENIVKQGGGEIRGKVIVYNGESNEVMNAVSYLIVHHDYDWVPKYEELTWRKLLFAAIVFLTVIAIMLTLIWEI